MAETLSYAAAALLMPPTSLVAATLGGMVLARRRPRLGWGIVVLSLLSLLALSTFAAAYALQRLTEVPPLPQAQGTGAQAIVVLGGGRNRGARDWNGETVNEATLVRLRYGARLARETGLPVLVTGGRPAGGRFDEGVLMRDLLQKEFGVTVRWAETRSNTTRENAEMSAPLLKQAGVKRILLVTDAIHMNRALPVFELQGLEVIAAPTGHSGYRDFAWHHLVPNAEALRLSSHALRESLGILYYRLTN